MSANIDSETLNMTNQDKNQSKWKAEAKVSDWVSLSGHSKQAPSYVGELLD